MRFIRHLVIELRKHKGWLQSIAAIVTIAGFPKLIPQEWWEHWLLSWSLKSQYILQVTVVILILSYVAISKICSLNNQLATLKEKKRIANLSPEDQADITKKQISDFGRFVNRLFSSNSNTTRVINDGSNNKNL